MDINTQGWQLFPQALVIRNDDINYKLTYFMNELLH